MNNLALSLLTSGDVGSIFEIFGLITLGIGIVWLFVLMFVYMILIAYAVVSYILQGKGLSAMLRTMGYEKPWLAWIPIVNVKALGDLADFYDNGEPSKNFGKKLLRFTIAELAVAFGGSIPMTFFAVIMGTNPSVGTPIFVIYILAYLGAVFGITIPYLISYYKALWAIYRIFCPKLSVLFLLLSIFVSGAEIFIIFAVRNREPQNLRAGTRPEPDANTPENPYDYGGF